MPSVISALRGHFLWCERRGEVYQPCLQGAALSLESDIVSAMLFLLCRLWGWLTVLASLQISFWLLGEWLQCPLSPLPATLLVPGLWNSCVRTPSA